MHIYSHFISMEYIVFILTLLTLFCGLLFFMNRFPTDWSIVLVRTFTIIVIIGSTLGVVGLIAWDVRTRVKYVNLYTLY